MKLLDSMYHIKEWRTDGTTTAADITFCPDHIIYQAHFPGQPVTPGVCILQIISELLEVHFDADLKLNVVKSMKFVKPISPVDDSQVTMTFQQIAESNGMVTVKGDISSGDVLYTRFTLHYGR